MATDPVIIFDTNSLRQISWTSAAFRQLTELSSLGHVKVFVPEIVYHERRTQWREEYSKASAEVSKILCRYASDPILDTAEQAIYLKINSELPKSDAEAKSHNGFETFFKQAGFIVIKVTQAHADEAFERYFAGRTPFKDVKNRADIPDGFVFAAAADVAEQEKAAYFLSSDKELSAAMKGVSGVTVVAGVEDVLKEPDLIALRDELDTNKAWLAVKGHFPMERARDELADWVSENSDRFLENKSVWSERIPSDENEGRITFHDRPADLVFSDFLEWGSGDLTTTATFTSDVQIDFMVFRGDTYSVPDWVSVDEGDFEKDHYFEATGAVRVAVKIELSLQAVIADDYDAVEEVLSGISLDHEPRISFLTGL
ncbi:PIN domain-containing protein [Sphingomonas sp. PP-CC-3G-468]|uniref:PIN domain-containing protein n=1 Tax=Sphingomonas sp. PP-CC-3G-468 TaxID=2135656 RepID=UPI0010446846|nr:PIN domain-containing protein [Sphingomonas sp. PP-CC-3G-468]TCM10349.1 hypothetical protein C8J41_101864 [Sphingomonas sp. PP-CC-3G-468]